MNVGLLDTALPGCKARFQRLLQDESGQDLIEYALVACLIALGAVASIKSVGEKIGTAFNGISSNVNNAV